MRFVCNRPRRLRGFDYSSDNAYFVTVCTCKCRPLFDNLNGYNAVSMIIRTFCEAVNGFEGVELPAFVVMPNHVHAMIIINTGKSDPGKTLSDILQSFKRYSTVEYIKMVKSGELPPFDGKIWERSFYEHIIRDEADYKKHYDEIRSNPLSWESDRFFVRSK